MIQHVTLGDAQRFIERAGFHVRDPGLIDAALYRPRAIVFGAENYKTLHEKGFALLDSLARAHPLIDGNKRLTWGLVVIFYLRNECRIEADIDEAEAFVMLASDLHLDRQQGERWLALHTGDDVPPLSERQQEEWEMFQWALRDTATGCAQRRAEMAIAEGKDESLGPNA